MGDHREVPRLSTGRRRPLFEGFAGLLVVRAPNEPPAPRHSRDMGVDREHGPVRGHGKHDVRRFRPDAWEGEENLATLPRGSAEDAIEVTAEVAAHDSRDVSDVTGLTSCEPRMPDRSFDCPRRRRGECLGREISERGPQPVHPEPLVPDRRALGKDRGHEDLERRHPGSPVRDPMPPLEDPHRVAERLVVHGPHTPPRGKGLSDPQSVTSDRSMMIAFRGRSRSLRLKYGSQFGPYGTYSRTR